jgi:proprotein convertase subtilisin/kexin type 5
VGYFRIQNLCGVCPAGTNYDDVTMTCLNICQNSQLYNNTTKQCDCNQNLGYYQVNGNCTYCLAGTKYNPISQTCENICPAGTQFNATTQNCDNKCTSGMVYNISTNTCVSICPSGTQFNTTSQTCVNICPSTQLFINGNCSCPTGLYYINNICGTCDIGFVYNSTSLSCVPICTDPNSYYKSGVCYCLAPFYMSPQLACLQCPTNTTYNSSTLNCSANPIPNPILNCNATSEIKTLNQTSGTYYCACSAANGYYLIFNYCGICQTFTKYNPLTLSCELDFTGLMAATNTKTIPIISEVSTQCHQSCSTCSDSSSTSCLTCANIYLTPLNGVCSSIRTN